MSDPLRIWLRMLSCTNQIERRVRDALRQEFATTLPRFDLLAQLDRAHREGETDIGMGELSRRLMVSNGNVTALAARLEREKLIVRERSAHDRRRQRVRLTPEGRRALRRMTAPHRKWIDDLFAPIRTEDRRELYRLLGQLRKAAGESTLPERARS